MYKYLVVDLNSNTLLATDSKEDALKALFGEFGEPAASEILTWRDGEYRRSEFEESVANGWIYG